MDTGHSEGDFSGWFSTYGLITTQRILEGYKIKLAPTDLIHALKNPGTFYYRIVQIPLRNVFNGIILQQVVDYQLYVQKLFVDYFMSGESSEEEEAPGAAVREDLEEKRKKLVRLNEDFRDTEFDHERLIAQSQATLMADARNWQKVLENLAATIKTQLVSFAIVKSEPTLLKAILILLVHDKTGKNDEVWRRVEEVIGVELSLSAKDVFIKEIAKLSTFTSDTEAELQQFHEKTRAMSKKLIEFRQIFYHFIIEVNELISLLPSYRPDPQKVDENKQSLNFDSSIGS